MTFIILRMEWGFSSKFRRNKILNCIPLVLLLFGSVGQVSGSVILDQTALLSAGVNLQDQDLDMCNDTVLFWIEIHNPFPTTYNFVLEYEIGQLSGYSYSSELYNFTLYSLAPGESKNVTVVWTSSINGEVRLQIEVSQSDNSLHEQQTITISNLCVYDFTVSETSDNTNQTESLNPSEQGSTTTSTSPPPLEPLVTPTISEPIVEPGIDINFGLLVVIGMILAGLIYFITQKTSIGDKFGMPKITKEGKLKKSSITKTAKGEFVFCIECGTANQSGEQFCTTCGTRLLK